MRTVITPAGQHTAEAGALLRHVLAVNERDRAALGRRMHDEMGGLLVSAAMDLGWAESHAAHPDVGARLQRLRAILGSAVRMQRDIIEQLRPTLLDTIGLFEALRWYFKHAGRRADARYREALPRDEVLFTPPALSNLFRATQALLDCTFQEEDLRAVDFEASISNGMLSIRLAHEHVGDERVHVLSRFGAELGCVAHRVDAVGGEFSCEDIRQGMVFQLTVALAPGVIASAV